MQDIQILTHPQVFAGKIAINLKIWHLVFRLQRRKKFMGTRKVDKSIDPVPGIGNFKPPGTIQDLEDCEGLNGSLGPESDGFRDSINVKSLQVEFR